MELEYCLTNVLENKAIGLVVLVHDNEEPVNTDIPLSNYLIKGKLINVYLKKRPTYEDFFDIANDVSEDGDTVIIANTDIYPEYGAVEYMLPIRDNDCYALSRYDKQLDGTNVLFDRWDSQDCLVFKAPIRPIAGCDFFSGIAGCDNAIADRIHKSGYNISNPSKTIQLNHFHLSGINNYNPDHKVEKPYLLINPHYLGDIPNLHSC
jgi:hypothetical protein